MKKALLIAAAAAMTFAGAAASAQPYGYGGYDGYGRYERDSDRDGRPDRREWNRDRDRDGRPDQWDRYDNRRGNRYGHYRSNRWRTGQYYPYYNNRGYYISDYHRYRLPPPRPGYRYYRSDNGDIVMAAIATGIIGLIIADALNDNDHRDYRYDRYDRYDRRW